MINSKLLNQWKNDLIKIRNEIHFYISEGSSEPLLWQVNDLDVLISKMDMAFAPSAKMAIEWLEKNADRCGDCNQDALVVNDELISKMFDFLKLSPLNEGAE